MVRVVLNPNFNTDEDVIEGAKGEFTCLQCREKFEKEGLRLPDGKIGFSCPKCGFIHYIKS